MPNAESNDSGIPLTLESNVGDVSHSTLYFKMGASPSSAGSAHDSCTLEAEKAFGDRSPPAMKFIGCEGKARETMRSGNPGT